MKQITLLAALSVMLIFAGCAFTRYSSLPEDVDKDQIPKIVKSDIPSFALRDEDFELVIFIGNPEEYGAKPPKRKLNKKEWGGWVAVNHAVDFIEVSVYDLWYRDPNRDVLKVREVFDISRFPKDKLSKFSYLGVFADHGLWKIQIIVWNRYVEKKYSRWNNDMVMSQTIDVN